MALLLPCFLLALFCAPLPSSIAIDSAHFDALLPMDSLELNDPAQDFVFVDVIDLPSSNLKSSISSLLDQNGMPIGLLPASVRNFSVSDNGQFEVYLDNACYAKFDYQVYYAQTITGKVSYGSITELSGIQAKELFFWVPVTGIRVDIPSSGYIYFDVGPISKKLFVSQFEQIPDCKPSAMVSSSFSRAFIG